jgi:hypothetical protein
MRWCLQRLERLERWLGNKIPQLVLINGCGEPATSELKRHRDGGAVLFWDWRIWGEKMSRQRASTEENDGCCRTGSNWSIRFRIPIHWFRPSMLATWWA